jgi:hypothetical protein
MSWLPDLDWAKEMFIRSLGLARWAKNKALRPTLTVVHSLLEALNSNLATDIARLRENAARRDAAATRATEAEAQRKVVDAFRAANEYREQQIKLRAAQHQQNLDLAKQVIQIANEQRSNPRASQAELEAAQEALLEAMQLLKLRGGEIFLDPVELERLLDDPNDELDRPAGDSAPSKG